MINRDEYLNQLSAFKDTSVIKVITGIRRCGKSTLFELYKQYLKEQGVQKENIIHINLEYLEYEELLDYKKLYKYVLDQLKNKQTHYIFLDEVQNLANCQKVINSLHLKKYVDLYVSASNAHFLSCDLATYLAGRYIEIKMQPLSFKEYVCATSESKELSKKYRDYINYSSFPGALEFKSRSKVDEYLDGVYNSIILKDLVTRLKISDVLILDRLIHFLFDNIGNITSTKKITDTMTSSGRAISIHTVEKYINGLQDCFIIHKVGRYDTKGKNFLKSGDKYYVADLGLRFHLLSKKQMDQGHVLENIIYLELRRRGYRISVGKVGTSEIDFIAQKVNVTEYYQVALSVRDEKTLKRELAPLESISDHNPKYLLTLDDDPILDYNGIKQINALDWLLK